MKKALLFLAIVITFFSCKKEVIEQNIIINENREKFKIEYYVYQYFNECSKRKNEIIYNTKYGIKDTLIAYEFYYSTFLFTGDKILVNIKSTDFKDIYQIKVKVIIDESEIIGDTIKWSAQYWDDSTVYYSPDYNFEYTLK